jgi:hypothetical protein
MIQTRIETKPGDYMMRSTEEIVNYVESHLINEVELNKAGQIDEGSDIPLKDSFPYDNVYLTLEYHETGSNLFMYNINGVFHDIFTEHNINLWVKVKSGMSLPIECTIEQLGEVIDLSHPMSLIHTVRES